ncbi:phage baseplate assembly protein V [Celerinatantimonas sp. MCCC 1A17872]|uniref:phage baseplate assembly protein V n=1 Tax=Celerinatantimonas sp. MCCC 1A17872 TaxID=3177514 RepID=UPI0038C2A701
MTIAEINRRLDNLIRIGVISELDYSRAEFPCARVSCGELLTHWLPLATVRAGSDGEHDPHEVGEQVIVLCPGGTLEQGVIIASLFSTNRPSPSTATTTHRRQYRDGAVIDYDTANHQLTATLPAGGKVTATASGGFTLIGDVKIVGNTAITGNLNAEGEMQSQGVIHSEQDVTAQSISLKGHRHSDVERGDETSGGPVA